MCSISCMWWVYIIRIMEVNVGRVDGFRGSCNLEGDDYY